MLAVVHCVFRQLCRICRCLCLSYFVCVLVSIVCFVSPTWYVDVPDAYSSKPSDFFDLVRAGFPFVDKTLFIEEYLRNPARVVLITRPRRWGKSMSLEMLKRFLEIELDPNDEPTPKAETINYKLFGGGTIDLYSGMKTELQPLKVSKCAYCMDRQGRYPVIYINFEVVIGPTVEKMKYHFRKEMEDLFLEFYYLNKYCANDSDLLTPDEKQKLQLFNSGRFTQRDMLESVRFLSVILHKHFQQKVQILIDNFDQPISRLYFDLVRNYELNFKNASESDVMNRIFHCDEFLESLQLFREFYRYSFEDNPSLDKALVTGIMRLGRGDVFAGLKSVREFGVLDKEFAEFYGFNAIEVGGLLNKSSLWAKREKIRNWYSGYTYGGGVFSTVNEQINDNISANRELLYNPWSVMKCLLQNGKLSTFWTDSCPLGLRDDALFKDQIHEKLSKLVDGKIITVNVTKAPLFNSGIETDIFTMLVLTGYLNPVHIEPLPDGQYCCQLSIPNEEIKTVFRDKKQEREEIIKKFKQAKKIP